MVKMGIYYAHEEEIEFYEGPREAVEIGLPRLEDDLGLEPVRVHAYRSTVTGELVIVEITGGIK